MADDSGTLQGRLMEIPEVQALPAQSKDALDDFIEKIQDFIISDSTQIQKIPDEFESYSDFASSALLRLPYGLRNSASIYQESSLGTTRYDQ